MVGPLGTLRYSLIRFFAHLAVRKGDSVDFKRAKRLVDQHLSDYKREDALIAEAANGIAREFHRTLNVVSGVMAAGIVLGGDNPNDLEMPMALALLCFVASLLTGLLFLHFLYASYRSHRNRRLDRLAEQVEALSDPAKTMPESVEEERGERSVPISLATNLARVVQMTLVATGFCLVLYSLGAGLLPAAVAPLGPVTLNP